MALIGSWHFNENDTANVRDYSTKGLDSVSVAGLTIVASDRGLAGRFDGSATEVNFGDVGSSGTDKLVIDFKIKFANVNTDQFIIDKDGEYRVELDGATSKLKFSIWFVVGGKYTLTANTALSADTWYRVICISNLSSMRIYVDGILDGLLSLAPIFHPDFSDTANDLLLGYEATPSNYLDADLEVIEIGDADLTNEEIDTLDKNMGGVETTFLAKHSFSEGDLLEWVSDIAGLSNSKIVCTLNKDATTILVIPISGRFVPGLRYKRQGNLFDTDRQWIAEIKETAGKPHIFFKDNITAFGSNTPDADVQIDLHDSTTGLFHFGRGMFITPTLSADHNTALLRGIEVIATMAGDAIDGTLQAIRALATYKNIGNGATVNAISAKISTTSGASAPTDPAVIIIESPLFQGAKPTNNHGLHIQDQGVAGITTSYGLKIEDQTGSTNKYAIKTGLGLVEFGDQIFDSNGNEIPPTNFAGITFDKNAVALVIGLVDSFYLIKNWDADMPELVSDGDFSSNDITVGATGTYRINLKIDGEAAAANKTFQWYVFEITSTTKAITGATAVPPLDFVEITATLHGFQVGNKVAIKTVGGMVELNDRIFTVLAKTLNTLTIGNDEGVAINGAGFTPYTSGGTLQLATETIIHVHRKFNAGGAIDIGDMSDSGIVPLTVNNTLELYIKGTADTTNFLHEHANLSLNRLN